MTTCPYCKREFKNERALTTHVSRWCVMSGCPICTGGVGEACSSHFL